MNFPAFPADEKNPLKPIWYLSSGFLFYSLGVTFQVGLFAHSPHNLRAIRFNP